MCRARVSEKCDAHSKEHTERRDDTRTEWGVCKKIQESPDFRLQTIGVASAHVSEV